MINRSLQLQTVFLSFSLEVLAFLCVRLLLCKSFIEVWCSFLSFKIRLHCCFVIWRIKSYYYFRSSLITFLSMGFALKMWISVSLSYMMLYHHCHSFVIGFCAVFLDLCPFCLYPVSSCPFKAFLFQFALGIFFPLEYFWILFWTEGNWVVDIYCHMPSTSEPIVSV